MATNGIENEKAYSGRDFSTVMRDLSDKISKVRRPADFAAVLIYGVPLYSSFRIAIEAGILELLAKTRGSLTAVQIAEHISRSLEKQENHSTTNSDDDLLERRDFLVRHLRILCAFGLVDEPAPFTYLANELTLAIANPGLAAGISQVYHGVMGPRSTMQEMVSYAKSNGWKAPETALDGPYQRAYEIIGMSTFEHWVKCDPEQMSRLNASMLGMQENFTHYLEWFPKETLFAGKRQDGRVFMVDVGGGYGHDIEALAATYPSEKVRLVLQDLSGVLQEGQERREKDGKVLDERIELMEHDFCEEQPVKGAEVYYMHKVMHDWPDRDCVRILTRIRDAMAEDSRILVNDCILLDQGCPLRPAVADIAMLAMHSGKERDEEMWNRLISKVDGLELKKFWHCPDDTGEGIVEIVKSTG